MSSDGRVAFRATLYDIRVKRDGGGRVQFDFGADALPSIQEIMAMNGTGDICFFLCLVPEGQVKPQPEVSDTGEIIF